MKIHKSLPSQIPLFNKNDIFVVILIVTLGVVSLISVLSFRGNSQEFIIHHEHALICSLPANIDTTFSIDSVNIVVQSGKLRIASSNCAKQYCVSSIPLQTMGQTVCLPNRVVITAQNMPEIDVCVQ